MVVWKYQLNWNKLWIKLKGSLRISDELPHSFCYPPRSFVIRSAILLIICIFALVLVNIVYVLRCSPAFTSVASSLPLYESPLYLELACCEGERISSNLPLYKNNKYNNNSSNHQNDRRTDYFTLNKLYI